MIHSLPRKLTFGDVSGQYSPQHVVRLSTASEGHRTCVFSKAEVDIAWEKNVKRHHRVAVRGFALVFALLVARLLVGAGDTKADDNKKPIRKPALPTEFAFVLSPGYGTIDHFPSDAAAFENLLINMKKAGFNGVHCVYRDWRIPLCRKHGVKMMVDILAWKEGAEMDVRRPKQRGTVKAICEKLRGEKAVWGYNLWNEKLPFFGYPDGKSIDDYVAMIKQWDPTHPIWMGTYQVSYANAPKQKPGVHGYYDYHWQRGFHWHFAALQWYRGYVPSQDGVFGRWMLGSDYNRNSYTLNTSIPFGLKVVIWFIGGPFDVEGNIDPKHRFYHLVKIGQEMHKLYPEIGKIGMPKAVYSTPTTKWHDNKDKETDVPFRLPPFPEDFWFRVRSGEAVVGFFKYPGGEDAIYVANHNAFAPQNMAIALHGQGTQKAVVQLLNRKTGQWDLIEKKDGAYAFPLRTAGGELLRVTGRVD